MDIRKILKKSWKIFRGRKKLLVLAVILGLASALDTFTGTFRGGDMIIRLSFCTLLIFFVVIILLSEISIIRITTNENRNLSIGKLLRSSAMYFWRMYGLSLLAGLPAIVVAFSLEGYQQGISTIGLECLIPVLLIFLPLTFVVMIVINLAQAKVFFEDEKAIESFRQTWNLANKNQRAFLKLGLVLIGGGFVFSNSFIFGWNFLASNYSGQTRTILAVILWVLYFLLTAIISGYSRVSWTVAYVTLSRKKR